MKKYCRSFFFFSIFLTFTFCGGGGSDKEECSDDCNPNDRKCEGDGFKVCEDTNGDGCVEWGNVVSCKEGEICQNGSCIEGCLNKCNPDERTCEGNGFKVCEDTNNDGCVEWSSIIACKEGETCKDGSCISEKKKIADYCSIDSDCESGYCWDLGLWKICSQACSSSPCPEGSTCGGEHCFKSCFTKNDCFNEQDCLKDNETGQNICMPVKGKIGTTQYDLIVKIDANGSWDPFGGAPDFYIIVWKGEDYKEKVEETGYVEDSLTAEFPISFSWYQEDIGLQVIDYDSVGDNEYLPSASKVYDLKKLFYIAYLIGVYSNSDEPFTYTTSDHSAKIICEIVKK